MTSDLAGQEHWDSRPLHVARRLPSRLSVTVDDLLRLLRRYVRPADLVLEVGCAPGKFLLWCALVAKARVHGIEYAPMSADATRELFRDMHVPIDLRTEDLQSTSFESSRFDVVYSFGLIEHFEDPRPIVRKHLELTKPGGTSLIVIPNYGGFYGRLQARLDSDNLAIHNCRIMNTEALRELVPNDLASEIESFPSGRLTPSLVSIEKRAGRHVGRAISLTLNCIGLLQPIQIDSLAPWLVLKIVRR